MADLITLDRAKQQIRNSPDSDDSIVASMVSACSAVVEKYDNRTFALASYDELHYGTGTPYLYVNNPPIQSISNFRSRGLPACWIVNNDTFSQTQLATVQVTSSAVVLSRIYNGLTTGSATFPFATYPNFSALVDGINALGSGWHATLAPQFALWQTSDLIAQQGSANCRNITTPLVIYWWGLSGYTWSPDQGEVYFGNCFYPGYQQYRIQYVGGFAEVPEEIQQATAELVQLTYATRRANPLMQSETLDKYSYTRTATQSFDNLSITAKRALNYYKLYRVSRWV